MQFMTLDPGRREMFWRTVNEDAEKLITEIGESKKSKIIQHLNLLL
jgi:hypothetical protein